MPDSLFTFQALTSLGGAAMLTFMIVQRTKNIGKLKNFPSDLYAVLIGSIVLFFSQIGTGANIADWRVYFLALANGFLVSYVAGKSHDDSKQQVTIDTTASVSATDATDIVTDVPPTTPTV